MLNALKCN